MDNAADQKAAGQPTFLTLADAWAWWASDHIPTWTTEQAASAKRVFYAGVASVLHMMQNRADDPDGPFAAAMKSTLDMLGWKRELAEFAKGECRQAAERN